jgi:histone H3/H4
VVRLVQVDGVPFVFRGRRTLLRHDRHVVDAEAELRLNRPPVERLAKQLGPSQPSRVAGSCG